jgi:uncharacterized protein YxjI
MGEYMKTYYLLKQNIIINNQRYLVDDNDKLMYHFKGNFFQTRFKVIDGDNTIVSEVSQIHKFRREYNVYTNDGFNIQVKSNKRFFHRLNDSVSINGIENYIIEGNIDNMNFTIRKNEDNLLIIQPYEKGQRYRKIIIQNDSLEHMLISLLFTILVVFDHSYANN